MVTRVDGGYVVVTVGQFANVCAARKSGAISFLALRVWLATHEQRAKRCTARGRVFFKTDEIARLVRVAEASVVKALSELQGHALIRWSETEILFPNEVNPDARPFAQELGTNPRRPVPVPRFILRALFRHTRPSEVMAAIAHLIRCLFRRKHEISNHGLIKASWVATVFGVGERSVHATRRWMVEQKFLTQEIVNQFVLNRWGGKFLVCLKQVKGQARVGRKSAPPSLTKSTLKSTSQYQNKNNKPGATVPGVDDESARAPSIRNILRTDLRQMPRLEALYRQAVSADWLADTEANLKNFVCAALRATRAGGRVGAVFVGIVRRALWHHVTQAEEDRALAVLKRYRERRPNAFAAAESTDAELESPVQKGAELLQTVLNCALSRPVALPPKRQRAERTSGAAASTTLARAQTAPPFGFGLWRS
jgi:hypothetical protein